MTIPLGSGPDAPSIVIRNVNGKLFIGYCLGFATWATTKIYSWLKTRHDRTSEKVDTVLQIVRQLQAEFSYLKENSVQRDDLKDAIREELVYVERIRQKKSGDLA